MAYIKSRKHAASKTSALAQIGLMAVALPVAAQTAPVADAPKKPDAPETTLPALRVTGQSGSEFKADNASSPKFTQPLLDTPQTITVIKKEVLQQQVATTLAEALRNTPGITMQLGENGNTTTGDSIFMRGFDTTNSIFVDGIRDLGNISRDVFNVEQVEVIKGPSGSDNGRGASSGYVNLVSKTAGREAFDNGTLTVGTASRVRATADLNRPLDLGIPGSALRLNVLAQDYGTPGRDEVKSKRFGFAPSLVLGLGTPTRTTFNYLYVDQKNVPDGGVSTFGVSDWRPATGMVSGAPVDSKNFYGSTDDFDDITLHMFTARVEHDLSAGTTLRNTTRLGHTEQDFVLTGVNAVTSPTGTDPATWTVARTRQGRHQTNEILTNQTNLSTEFKTGGIGHSLSTGFEFIYERQNQVNKSVLGAAQGAANLYHPSTGDVFRPLSDTGAYTKGSTLSAAAYAFDTLKFSEQWLLNGGLRWEKFHTETNSATYSATATPNLVQNPGLGLTDNLLSWKVGALFKPTQDGSVYLTVSNSYQPPGGANFSLNAASTNQASPNTDPQEGSNIELGTKWDLFGGKLAATAAIYRSENKNELVSDGATSPTFTQVGKRRVDGVELGLVGQVTPALNLSAGVAYMDPKIIRGVPAGASATNGGLIVYSPKVTFSSWASYKALDKLTVGGGVRYVDTVARSSNLTPGTTPNLINTESYTVADAMVAYDLSKNVSLQLNVNNLFDKEYVASVNNGGSRYKPGEPRSALLSANFKY
ncbi:MULTISPECIES: catecholate siderophore receptor Fiu [unclassified Rhizobacter]|uniref:catecholate siderophore receptor Fiu n=1 Tax=unclassified Rhizobacter TaxID=2640088 RepID=UPI0006FA9D2F|nr:MULTISPECIES: catecholate siderophore receptor Fiu [unclassified Rhizobacter]KQU76755.1 TonB-dependent receptor [Rhizobacter sp. Root29]KQV97276.1 TonB-dependent receptor [Rhizobacter sp. Root1238]KRB09948.1 TonB-dependent receptor [Rhizobacter sp. Root16D2]